jgi:beta-lactamase regulating signal transducer with metallopeptidase domain
VNPLQQFAPAALNWFWQTSLAAAILVVIALLIQWTCGRAIGPRWTYMLWLLVVVRLMMPVAPESSFSVFNVSASRPPSEVVRLNEPTKLPPTAPQPLINFNAAPAPTLSPPVFTLPLLGILFWITGALGYFSFCLLQYRRFAAWARRQTPVSDNHVLEALCDAQRLLGYPRSIPVLATTTLRVPALFGFLHPRLLVPQAMLDTWSTDELRHAFLHELIHARRRDHLLNWVLIVVQAVHWFNPITYFALRRLRAERELLCDAVALSCMNARERHSYGAALVKAAQEFACARISPAIVPMLNHNQELKRRVSMIAQFKPTSRLISIAALAALVLLVCFTFTSKAQKVKPPEIPPAQREPANQADVGSIKVLQVAYDELSKQVEDDARVLEAMRDELNIPGYLAYSDNYQPGPEMENIRRLEGLRLEAMAEYQSIQSLYGMLTNLSPGEFRNTISIAAPDAQFLALLARQNETEQQLAALSEKYSTEHPEVVSLKRMLTTINRQIVDKELGMLEGMKAKTAQFKARFEGLDRELTELRKRDREAPTHYRVYFTRKRELENLQQVRDRLQMRILEEKINSALTSTPTQPGTAPAKP